MPTPRSQLAILLFAGVMLVAAGVVRIQRPLRHDAVQVQPISYRVPINHADRDTLCLLPGVGPGIAVRIIDHRDAAGPFRDADDLESVRGIGVKTRAAIEPWVGFESAD